MPESQQHGCIWEDFIKKDVYRVTQKIPYTSEFDIPKELNIHSPDTSVSIKTTQSKSVDMGDALRIYNQSGNIDLLVLRYKQEEDEKKLVEIVRCKMPSREQFFQGVTLEEIQKLQTMIKSVPSGKPDETLLQSIHTYKESLNSKSGFIHFRPKLDSKNQRRLQCSIVDFEAILTKFPELILDRNTEGKLFTTSIPITIRSCRRQRNARQSHSEHE